MDGSAPGWAIEDGALRVVPGQGDVVTTRRFGDQFLHLEFRLSDMPDAKGQAKSNSGVFIQGRYEIQVLDSSGWESPGFSDCGAIYNQLAPLSNACKPGLEWQTYDIVFRAPRCEGKVVREQARLTVIHNGTVIHNNVETAGPTGAPSDLDVQLPGHLRLQDHNDIVRYRNIWLVELPKEGSNTYSPR